MKKDNFLMTQNSGEFAAQIIACLNIENFNLIEDALKNAGEIYNNRWARRLFAGRAPEYENLMAKIKAQKEISPLNAKAIFKSLNSFLRNGTFVADSLNVIFLREFCILVTQEHFLDDEKLQLTQKIVDAQSEFFTQFSQMISNLQGESNDVEEETTPSSNLDNIKSIATYALNLVTSGLKSSNNENNASDVAQMEQGVEHTVVSEHQDEVQFSLTSDMSSTLVIPAVEHDKQMLVMGPSLYTGTFTGRYPYGCGEINSAAKDTTLISSTSSTSGNCFLETKQISLASLAPKDASTLSSGETQGQRSLVSENVKFPAEMLERVNSNPCQYKFGDFEENPVPGSSFAPKESSLPEAEMAQNQPKTKAMMIRFGDFDPMEILLGSSPKKELMLFSSKTGTNSPAHQLHAASSKNGTNSPSHPLHPLLGTLGNLLGGGSENEEEQNTTADVGVEDENEGAQYEARTYFRSL